MKARYLSRTKSVIFAVTILRQSAMKTAQLPLALMKMSHLLSLSCSIIILSGCASKNSDFHDTPWPGPHSESLVPPPIPNSDGQLQLISAVYGSGTNFDDVTQRVNVLLNQSSVEFYARPEWLHVDPTPGWNKALVIVLEVKGDRRIFTTGEGGKVTLDILDQAAKKEKIER